jgi:hypothetical protein
MICPVYGENEKDVVEVQNSDEERSVPESVYASLDHLLSLFQPDTDLDRQQLQELIDFVRATPAESNGFLKERNGASGAFHVFDIHGSFDHILEYSYNPDIPVYVTMPSSLQEQQWLTPEVIEILKKLPQTVESGEERTLLRGREQEVITPDTNTGGYYQYSQDRIVMALPASRGPVLISITNQSEPSEVGKKGCVVGDDKNWNYLYSDEKGINKTGLGWVDSFMYFAYSVIVYAADTTNNVVRVSSFKWLNAGWAKINMVKSSHILEGIKRFASDYKEVLESPDLPEPDKLQQKYLDLKQADEPDLRLQASSYLQALNESEAIKTCPKSFRNMVSSGEYLEQMSREEMIRVLLLEYIKENIGRESFISSKSQIQKAQTLALSP